MNLCPAFYAPEFNPTTAELPSQELHHALHVLRMQIQDKLTVLNGKGQQYHCLITSIVSNKLILEVTNTQQAVSKPRVRLAVAPPKNPNRLGFLVEKTAELGVTHLDFIQCQHSVRTSVPLQRLQRIAISALKQSHQFFLLTLKDIEKFSNYLKKVKEEVRVLAHAEGNLCQIPGQVPATGKDCCVLIGPEGGFSAEEITMAEQNNFISTSLGKQRLRTETASLLAAIRLSSTL